MRIDVRRRNDAEVVRVSGTLDLVAAPRLRAVLDARLAQGRRHLVVDLVGVRAFDPRAAAPIAVAADRAWSAGGSMSALAAGPCRDLLGIIAHGRRLRVYDDPAPVLRHLDSVAPDEPAGGGTPTLVSAVDDPTWPGSRDVTVHALLTAVAALPEDSTDRAELRRQAIEHAMPLARHLSRRFRDRGEPGDDLTQVAMLGLVNAIDGYDPSRGCEFAGYATPTIVGELRRYFRDKGWRIRVPRRVQELRVRVNQASAELAQARAATPTIADIATHLSVPENEVAEAVEAGLLYQPLSLQAPSTDGTELELAGPLGEDDPAIAVVDERESVRPLIATLPERERAILRMRYFGDMTQSQIADRLGISQMHVSRLLTQILSNLRTALADAA